MAGDGSGTGPSEPPKEASSSVIIRAIPLSFRDEKEKEAFWQAYAAYVDQVTPKPSTAGTPATTQPKTAFDYESLIKDKFPVALKEGFKSFLSVPYGAETRTRQRALIALRFSVKEISYGPIGIETTIENLDKIIDASLTLDAAIAILSTSAPGALNAALGSSYPMWAIAISDVNLRRPPPSKGEPETSGWRWFFARFPNPVTILTLLILLWIVPIAVTLFVLMSTYLEMNRRISSYDKDLLKVQTDEIARARTRFDEQHVLLLQHQERHALLLQRQENVLKESTDSIRAILADEKRAQVRPDQQQVCLLQRCENLSKESSEIIKALIQKPDGCCKPCSCGCKGEKDRSKGTEGKCQNSADSK